MVALKALKRNVKLESERMRVRGVISGCMVSADTRRVIWLEGLSEALSKVCSNRFRRVDFGRVSEERLMSPR